MSGVRVLLWHFTLTPLYQGFTLALYSDPFVPLCDFLCDLLCGQLNIRFNSVPAFRNPIIADVVNRPAIMAPVTPQVRTS